MSVVGCVRASTVEQNPALQIDALTAAGAARIVTDHASGATTARPALGAALDLLRPGDVLTVWRIDRLGRSVADLVTLIGDLGARGVQFRSLTEAIDTTTPGGELVLHTFAALAQMERRLVSERTHAGLNAARARGRVGGRPTVMTPNKLAAAISLRATTEMALTQIAAQLGISRTTLITHLGTADRASTPTTTTTPRAADPPA